MSRRRPGTLKDVAEQAGVSIMTVSLALRGEEGAQRMSPETRQRVLLAAKELSYSPNARARALRLGRTNVIGLYAGHGFVNVRTPFFTEIVSGLQEGCEQIRKDLLLHGTFHGTSSEDIFLELMNGRIDGLVVTMPPTDPLAARLAQSGFSVVAVADALPGIPAVVVDDAEGSALVANHLYELGHRKVAYGLGVIRPTSSQRRFEAFLKSAETLGVEVLPMPLRAVGQFTELTRRIVDTGATAVACWNDDLARYLVAGCHEIGVRVPQDLAIVGFDGFVSPYPDPFPLTTVSAPWAEAARMAVLALDSLLRGEQVADETSLPVKLIKGKTT